MTLFKTHQDARRFIVAEDAIMVAINAFLNPRESERGISVAHNREHDHTRWESHVVEGRIIDGCRKDNERDLFPLSAVMHSAVIRHLPNVFSEPQGGIHRKLTAHVRADIGDHATISPTHDRVDQGELTRGIESQIARQTLNRSRLDEVPPLAPFIHVVV